MLRGDIYQMVVFLQGCLSRAVVWQDKRKIQFSGWGLPYVEKFASGSLRNYLCQFYFYPINAHNGAGWLASFLILSLIPAFFAAFRILIGNTA
jgi:hypothetical protein